MPYASSPVYWVGSTKPSIPEDLEPSDFVEYARASAQSEAPYVFYGPPGTGKTTLMAITASLISNPQGGAISYRTRHLWLDKRVLWAQASEYCRDVKAEFDISRRWSDFDANYSASGLAALVPCLFIDDLGVEQSTDYNADTMAQLVDSRYRAKLPTWFTTNLSIRELSDRYGDRTLSRLAEHVAFIPVNGDDRRTRRIMS